MHRPARLIAALLPLAVGARLAAQDTTRVNIYRFILGVDLPEPAAFVALGASPTRVLRGSAPKPIAAGVLDVGLGDAATPGVAVDVAPYFLLGGGARTLERFRAMSLGGRLTRVLTKTVFSLGAVRDPAAPASPLMAVALRSTIHDPHDPALNSRLPEDVADLLRRAGALLEPGDEDATERGADLTQLFARARRTMRARAGDPQISFGWGIRFRARSGSLAADSVVAARHSLWASAQLATGPRLDVLTTIQWRDAFRDDARVWVGLGVERKSTAVDYRLELSYDTRSHDLHPGASVDARAAVHLSVGAALAAASASHLELRTLLQWFYASDR